MAIFFGIFWQLLANFANSFIGNWRPRSNSTTSSSGYWSSLGRSPSPPWRSELLPILSIIPEPEEEPEEQEKKEKDHAEVKSNEEKVKKVNKSRLLEMSIVDAIKLVNEEQIKKKRKEKDEKIRKLALEQKARKQNAAGKDRVRIHV